MLKLLASQAAISLENSRLYRDLAEREAKIRRLVDANIIGIFIWDFEGRILEANDAFLRMVGYDREDLVAGRMQLDGPDAAGMARPRRTDRMTELTDDRNRAAIREGVLPEGRQPRARAARRGDLRRRRKPRCRFRARFDRAQAGGRGAPTSWSRISRT